MKRTSIVTAGLISLVVISLSILPGLTFSNRTSNDQSGQQSAAMNYQKFCAGCHGQNLEKFAANRWMEQKGNENIVRSIKNGIEIKGMPAFQNTFTDEEIVALAEYVKKGIPEDKSKLQPALTEGGIVYSEVQRFKVDTVVTGLKVPWGLVFLPNGDLLISEREGTLHTFSKGKLSPPISGLPPIRAEGQGGLLDLCLHPDYKNNGWIYIAYSALNTESKKTLSNTAIMRAKLQDGKLTNQQIIYKGDPQTAYSHHYGIKMVFDNKGHIFSGTVTGDSISISRKSSITAMVKSTGLMMTGQFLKIIRL
jgi:aldose sugar dehydrogenase